MDAGGRESASGADRSTVSDLGARRGLGHALRLEMDRRSMTQQQAADELEVSVQGFRKWLQQRPHDGSSGPRMKQRPKLMRFLRLDDSSELDAILDGRAASPAIERDAKREQTERDLSRQPLTADQVDTYLDRLLTPGLSNAQVSLVERLLVARGLPPAPDAENRSTQLD